MNSVESNTSDLLASLKAVRLFRGVEERDLSAVLSICRKISLGAGEIVFEEGSDGTELFIVTRGRVGVEIQIAGGARETVFEAKRDDIFGELALLDTHTRSVTARAIGETGLRAVGRAEFFELIQLRPTLGVHIMTNLSHILSERLREANKRFREIAGQQLRILELVNLTLT